MKSVLIGVIAAGAMALANAADWPAPQEGVYVAKDFRFHTGEVLPEVKLGYRTLGTPGGDTVVVLHGTGGSSASMLTPAFAGQLFGPGQPLDASRYFIVIPDAIGHGRSSKPSDGLKTRFPKYDYADMVEGHHRLLTEHFRLPRVRLVIGNSMGGMETWIYATRHPEFIDIAIPMACLPTEMGSRNWMMRRLIVDSIRNDPDWKNGEYTVQPKSPRFATVFYQVATNGGNHGWYKAAPTRAKADQVLDARLAAPFNADANDVLYQWESSGDYNPSPDLERIRATVVSINAADDERNPVELGLLEREIKRVRHGRLMIIPSGPETSGHGTTGSAKWYAREVADLMANAPRLAP